MVEQSSDYSAAMAQLRGLLRVGPTGPAEIIEDI